MKKGMNSIAQFASQAVFSIITPPLLVPTIGNLRLTRNFIAFFFGRLYGNRYDELIGTFDGRYGLAMAQGLATARERLGRSPLLIVDCGTGTGFVTRQAAGVFPGSTVLAFDLLPNMLELAQKNCEGIDARVFHVLADSFTLPMADGTADLLLVQNTMPCFSEFARVLRPGGIVVYVDSAAGWIANLAQKLVRQQGLFETVEGSRVDTGFYVLAQKGRDAAGTAVRNAAGKTMESLLRCPIDRKDLVPGAALLRCPLGHSYDRSGKFLNMLPNKIPAERIP